MHYAGMRSHSDIAKGQDTARQMSELLGVSVHTVRSWAQRDSIPPEYWSPLANANIASLNELAAAAAARRSAAA
jgi:DNA-binding transcriptional regulator YiaG